MFCKYCGTKIDDGAYFCRKCGKSIEENSYSNINSNQNEGSKAKKRGKACAVVFVIVLILLVIFGYKAYRFVAELKYQDDIYSAYECIINGLSDSEDVCVLTSNVWRNCICETDEKNTNKYTKDEEGSFYLDFNDALEKLYQDPEIVKKQKDIYANQSKAVDLMRVIKNPPEKHEEEYEAMDELYDVFVDFSSLALYSGGYTLNEYSEDVKEYQQESIKCIQKVNMYLN